MNIQILPGKYIVAVSGGVDSMVLLNLLKKNAELDIIVGHLDHGVRDDSYLDERFVAEAAGQYGLVYESKKAKLGSAASEDTARTARYDFLENLNKKHKANGIITAHHQDDLIETAILNLLRGTGPSGLVSMLKNKKIVRPLLHVPKSQIIKYAKDNDVQWREDSTNQDTKHLRNYIRKNLIPKLSKSDTAIILKSIHEISVSQAESHAIFHSLSLGVKTKNEINRTRFINLPMQVCNELVAFWLRECRVLDFDRSLVQRLSLVIKTAKPGTKHNVINGLWLVVNLKTAIFQPNR